MPLILNGTTGVSGVDGSAGTPSYQGGDTNTGIFYPAADTIAFTEGGVESMRIDSSGNVGIGVTPSAWSGYKSIDLQGGSVASGSATNFELWCNSFYNGTNSVYRNTGFATLYSQGSGNHIWYGAASGSSGATITFSERMRIDSSGNVGIGTSSPSALGRLTTSSASSSNYTSIIAGSNTSLVGTDSNGLALSALGANNIVCYTVGFERMRINSAGNLLVGTTTAPVQHTSTAGSIVATGSINSFSGNVGNTTTGTSYNLFTAVAGASYIVNINAANTCSVYLVTCEVSSSAVTNTPLLIQNGANVTNSGTTIRFTNNFGGNLNNVGWSAIRLI